MSGTVIHGETIVSSTNSGRQLDIHMKKNEVSPLAHITYKISSRWIKDLSIRAKTIKLLEGNIDVNLHDLNLGNGFLVVTPKTKANKKNGFHQS